MNHFLHCTSSICRVLLNDQTMNFFLRTCLVSEIFSIPMYLSLTIDKSSQISRTFISIFADTHQYCGLYSHNFSFTFYLIQCQYVSFGQSSNFTCCYGHDPNLYISYLFQLPSKVLTFLYFHPLYNILSVVCWHSHVCNLAGSFFVSYLQISYFKNCILLAIA